MRRLCLALACIVCAPALAEEPGLRIHVATDPPGARLSIDGVIVGTSPSDLNIGSREGRMLEANLDGYEIATLDLPSSGGGAVILPLTPLPGLIEISSTDDRPPAYDGTITLREALLYASGAREALGADAALVSGLIGAGRADTIRFAAPIFANPAVIALRTPLPALAEPGDRIVGPEAPLHLMPATQTGARVVGLTLGAGTAVSGLTLSGFDIGIDASGPGLSTLENLIVTGAEIGLRADDAITLDLTDVAVEARLAQRLVGRQAAILGQVKAPPLSVPPTRAAIALLDGAAEDWLMLRGRFVHEGQVPTLFTRQAEPVPLHAVAGVEAEASSYYASFRLFVEEGQQWPRYAVDGAENAFLWEFDPETNGAGEWLEIRFARPLRASELTVRTAEYTGRLLRYRLELLDLFGQALWATEIETNGSADRIAVDPTLDFFAIRIEIIEAEGGGSPGIAEIVAEVHDSLSVPALAYAATRAVFAMPTDSPGGLYLIGTALYPLGAQAYASGHEFMLDRTAPAPARPERVRIHVGSARDEDVADDALTLREALAIAAGSRPVAPNEAAHVVGGTPGPGIPITIRLAVPEVALDTRLVAGHADLVIEGDGARLTWSPSAPDDDFLLQVGAEDTATMSGRLVLNNLAFEGGGVEVRRHELVAMRRGTVSGAPDEALWVDAERLLLRDVTLVESPTGATSNAEAHIIGSRFEANEVGLDLIADRANVLVGNNFVDVTTPLRLSRAEFAGNGRLVLLGNQARGGPALVAGPEDGATAVSIPAVSAGNQPPRLGLPEELLRSNFIPIDGGSFLDRRTGGSEVSLRHLDLADPDGQVIVDQAGRRAMPDDFLTVLYDTPLEVWYAGADTGHRFFLSASSPPVATIGSLPGRLEGAAQMAATLQATTTPVEVGGPLPVPGDPVRSGRNASQVVDLVQEGAFNAAVMAGLRSLSRSPGDSEIASAVVYALEQWALALEQGGRPDAAGEMLAAIVARQPDLQDIDAVFARHLHRRAASELDGGDWMGAIAQYDRLLTRNPDDAVARNNLIVAYQEAARTRAETEPAAAVLDWLEQQARGRPAEQAAELRDLAGLVAQQAADQAMAEEDYPAAFAAYELLYDRAPDGFALNNLLFVTQEWTRAALAADGPTAAIHAYREAMSRRPELGADLAGIVTSLLLSDLDGNLQEVGIETALAQAAEVVAALDIAEDQAIAAVRDQVLAQLPAVFLPAAEAAASAGEPAAAISIVLALRDTVPDTPVDDLIAYVTQSGLEALAARDEAAALETSERLAQLYRGEAEFVRGALYFLNNAAIGHFDTGDYAGAARLLERALSLSDDDALIRSNLRAAYLNASVGLIEAGAFEDAVALLERALQHFPNDPDILNNLEFARQESRSSNDP